MELLIGQDNLLGVEMNKFIPKERIWLSAKGKDGWCYALARYKDGSIRVVEHLMNEGFASVGSYGIQDDPYKEAPCRLYKGERRMIIEDLFLACAIELKIDKKTMLEINEKCFKKCEDG